MGSVTSLAGFGGCKIRASGLIIVLKVNLISIQPPICLTAIPFSVFPLCLSVFICTLTLPEEFCDKSISFWF